MRLVDDEHHTNINDPSTGLLWLKVANSYGHNGLIPSNCVQPFIDTSNNTSNIIQLRNNSKNSSENNLFSNQIWYFGSISRYEANLLLNKYGCVGDFLVRDCERDVSELLKLNLFLNKFMFLHIFLLLFKGW